MCGLKFPLLNDNKKTWFDWSSQIFFDISTVFHPNLFLCISHAYFILSLHLISLTLFYFSSILYCLLFPLWKMTCGLLSYFSENTLDRRSLWKDNFILWGCHKTSSYLDGRVLDTKNANQGDFEKTSTLLFLCQL